MSNSTDPDDEMAHYELSHLDLSCSQKPIIIDCGSERVKLYNFRESLQVNLLLNLELRNRWPNLKLQDGHKFQFLQAISVNHKHAEFKYHFTAFLQYKMCIYFFSFSKNKVSN